MTHAPTIFLRAALLLTCWASATDAQQIEVAFSPRGGCSALIAKHIDAATTSIDLTAYQLTAAPLADRIAAARSRGVQIRIIVDRAQETEPTPIPKRLAASGLALRTDAVEKLHHNKYAIIDSAIVITGSYNWSENAENSNAENVVVLHDAATAAAFTANFTTHWNHSRQFSPHRPAPRPHIQPRAHSPPQFQPA